MYGFVCLAIVAVLIRMYSVQYMAHRSHTLFDNRLKHTAHTHAYVRVFVLTNFEEKSICPAFPFAAILIYIR